MEKLAFKFERELRFNAELIKNSVLVYRALDNGFRQQLIKLLHESGPMNVKAIYKKFKVEQALVSGHLAILRQQKFVNTEKVIREVYYSLN
jgi:predicted transcriptional regulator